MSIPPLAIIQARMNSTRLLGKMLLKVDGVPLIERVWRETCHAVGVRNVVIAHPATSVNNGLAQFLDELPGMQRFAWEGPESDLLGRFYHCANLYRWHPETRILRVTPDDPFKEAGAMRRVLRGERLPVELGGEAFTLDTLNFMHIDGFANLNRVLLEDGFEPITREHLTPIFFHLPPPPAPVAEHPWSIDTQADYDAVAHYFANRPPIELDVWHECKVTHD